MRFAAVILSLFLLPCQAWAAAFSSSQDGNWQDGATWGNASPGVEGTDFPGSGDTATITHTVTINDLRPSSGAVGNITVSGSGILTWDKDSNGHLVFDGAISVTGGGEWRMGTEADPISSTNTATLEAATTATRTMTITTTGFLSMHGHSKFANPDTEFYTRTAEAISSTSERTVELMLNVETAGWAAGDEIVIVPSASKPRRYTIASVSGADITITEDWDETSALGAHIANLTRNVRIVGSGGKAFRIVNQSTTAGRVVLNWVEFNDVTSAQFDFGVFNSTASAVGKFVLDNSVFNHTSDFGVNHRAFVTNNLGQTHKNLVHYGGVGNLAFFVSSNTVDITFDGLFAVMGGTGVSAGVSVGAIIKGGNSTSFTIKNFVFADRKTDSQLAELLQINLGNNIILENGYIYGAEDTGGGGFGVRFKGFGGLIQRNVAYGHNGYFARENGTADIDMNSRAEGRSGSVIGHNVHFETGNAIGTIYESIENKHIRTSNLGMNDKRHSSEGVAGIISDQITGGQASGWANSHDICLLMNPTSTSNPLEWTFWIPVTDSAETTVSAYVRKTASGGTCSLNLVVYDSDDGTEKVVDEDITLTDSWVEWTSPSFMPGQTGFSRSVFTALDGGTTCDIGIDDITISPNPTANMGGFERWRADMGTIGPSYIVESGSGGGEFSHTFLGF